MTEMNPEHPTTRALSDQWHKLLAVVVWKYGGKAMPVEPIITVDDFNALQRFDEMPALVAQEKADGLHLRIVTKAEGERLVEREREKYGRG